MPASTVTASEDEKPGLVSEAPLSGSDDMSEGPSGETPESDPKSGSGENPLALVDTETGREYISGLQLVVVMASVVLVAFMMLLDTSIIATVSRLLPLPLL